MIDIQKYKEYDKYSIKVSFLYEKQKKEKGNMKKLMKSVLACLLAFAMVLTVMPVNSYAAAKKSVVVTNQKQLEKALKNGATNIVIKTNKNVKITIPATKKAAKASISVQAKNATITNKASVKSIVIKDAKAFVESGKNNDIKITDSKLSLTVAKESKGADIRVAKIETKKWIRINVVSAQICFGFKPVVSFF